MPKKKKWEKQLEYEWRTENHNVTSNRRYVDPNRYDISQNLKSRSEDYTSKALYDPRGRTMKVCEILREYGFTLRETNPDDCPHPCFENAVRQACKVGMITCHNQLEFAPVHELAKALRENDVWCLSPEYADLIKNELDDMELVRRCLRFAGHPEIKYYFSFCKNLFVSMSETFHCRKCGMCKPGSEWHCRNCNKCSYGHTLPCENCAPLNWEECIEVAEEKVEKAQSRLPDSVAQILHPSKKRKLGGEEDDEE